MPSSPGKLMHAAQVLRAGGLVAFPTETVYGLGADATSPQAVARIFAVKRRPRFDPLIVHVADMAQARRVADLSPLAEKLAKAFWPGPLTLVLPKRAMVPEIVTSGLDTVGVRMPDHRVAIELIHMAGTPVAAPSANRFGQVSPTSAEAVREQLGTEIDVILDGGPCRVGVESTVVLVQEDGIELLRPGGVSIEELEPVAGRVTRGVPVHERPLSPGLLRGHYSPGPPVVLIDEGGPVDNPDNAGLLAFRRPRDGVKACEVLTERGALTEAAANLFGALRRLGQSGVSVIYAERVPDRGLGVAILDRLSRAAESEG